MIHERDDRFHSTKQARKFEVVNEDHPHAETHPDKDDIETRKAAKKAKKELKRRQRRAA